MEETFSEEIASYYECGVLQDLLTSMALVSRYSVCGVPVNSKVRKYVQTVPRHMILSRMTFSKP